MSPFCKRKFKHLSSPLKVLKNPLFLYVKFGLSEKHTEIPLPHGLEFHGSYLVNVQTMRKIFSNFVCFSKSPNFNQKIQFLWLRAERMFITKVTEFSDNIQKKGLMVRFLYHFY